MKYNFLLMLIFLVQSAFAQFPLSGEVYAENSKRPLEGVSVFASNAGRYVTTNELGLFKFNTLQLPETLIFSFVGYSTKSMVIDENTSNAITILLAKSAVLTMDSVVVYNTGYQVISKERATGSFTHVTNKILSQQVSSNILDKLESVSSSLAFNKKNNTAPTLSVRGLSSINGPTAPLIVLDNFPYEGDINSINPNLIESVTILKDATAASIWGTRAGNGVIVINTKKAKNNQPLTVELNTSMQVHDKADLNYLKTINPSDYIDVEQFLFDKGYYTSALTDNYHPPVSPVVELLDKAARGIISMNEAQTGIMALKRQDVKGDYARYVYKNAVNRQLALNFSGGSSNFAWIASGGYDKNTSELAEKYERISTRLENTFRPTKNLRVTSSLYYTNVATRSSKESYVSQKYMYPYGRFYDGSKLPISVARDFRASFTDTNQAGKMFDWNYYPAENYKHSYSNAKSNNLIANIGLHYQFGSGITFDFKYQHESQLSENKMMNDEKSYDARYFTNLFAQVNSTSGAINYIVPKGGILDITNEELKVNNIRQQINYNTKWGQNELIAFIGNEIREIKTTGEGYKTYGFNEDTYTTAAVDFSNQYPIFPNGDLISIPGGQNEFNETRRRFVSFYSNMAYTFKSKYNIALSGRRDASNLFGVNTNNKWTPLWSAGLGWDISRENFFKSKLFSYLKLRATYGYTGNADPTKSAIVTLSYSGNSLTTNFPVAKIRQFPNPTLRWEKIIIKNIGMDFSLKNDRVSGSVEWYSKKGVDLFGKAEVDITAGLGQNSITKNVAAMKGKGLDVVMITQNIRGEFYWNTAIIFNYNSERVTEVYVPETNASKYISDGDGITSIIGRPVHAIISYQFNGLNPLNGNPQSTLDGKITTDYAAIVGSGTKLSDLVFSGSALPQIFGSISNTAGYKGWELTLNVGYKLHYFFKRNALHYGNLFANDKKSSADFAQRWRQPGDEQFTDVPSMIYPTNGNRDFFYASSAALVEKGDHVRLQYANLAYNFNYLKKKSPSTKSCQLYFNASNLGILWRANRKGIDPDYSAFSIPPAKAYTIGFKLFFQ